MLRNRLPTWQNYGLALRNRRADITHGLTAYIEARSVLLTMLEDRRAAFVCHPGTCMALSVIL